MSYSPDNPQANLDILAQKRYPGRLLVVGRSTIGFLTHVYVVGGRSDESKNRVLREEDGIVFTQPFDPKKSVGNPKLTIYDAMRRAGTTHVVSNGDHTTTGIQFLRSGKSFEAAMNTRHPETDKLHTARIGAFSESDPVEGEPSFAISSIVRNRLTKGPLRRYYKEGTHLETPDNGVGYAMQTYVGDIDSPVTFGDRPFPIPLEGNSVDIAGTIWERLDPETRVAIAAKTIFPNGHVNFHIINEHEQAA
jgi:IMP cyclohydrolase